MLARALGRPQDVEHVVEQLEGEPDPAPEAADPGGVAAALERPELPAAWKSRAVLRSQRAR